MEVDEDALFAAALMQQDLRDEEAADARLAAEMSHRHQRRQQRDSAATQVIIPADEDDLMAAVLMFTQVQAEEQQLLQDALEMSRHSAGLTLGCPGNEADAFARIQRESLMEAIRSQLPVFPWSSKETKAAEECALCLENYAEGDCMVRLCCLHMFHKACLDPWLAKNSTCPSCKSDLLSSWSPD
ncbi:unnamed protein product [Polarella glacialis]|uniref:RING-type domain-containing protein n=1 Tax=Polarella glacialis TaxID=89957 RepID=A0A813E6M3_POLGL|nr:unnamed protein product [Polarella glacialis]